MDDVLSTPYMKLPEKLKKSAVNRKRIVSILCIVTSQSIVHTERFWYGKVRDQRTICVTEKLKFLKLPIPILLDAIETLGSSYLYIGWLVGCLFGLPHKSLPVKHSNEESVGSVGDHRD